jgi:parvulin-like peptidyl-prolyl isomerase
LILNGFDFYPTRFDTAAVVSKFIFTLSACFAGGLVLFASTSSVQSGEIIDGVAAIANNRIITISDIREYSRDAERRAILAFANNPAELQKALHAIHKDALNTLIDRALIVDDFDRKGNVVPDYAITSRLREIIASRFGGDRHAFRAWLRSQNLTEEQYRKEVREQLIIENYAARQIAAEIIVSPSRIKQYYEAHQAQFHVEDQVRLRMIFIRKDANQPEQIAAKREMAQEILSKLDSGRPFAEMAKAYSDAPQAATGGDWGWVDRKTISKEFADVAFALGAGEHSDILETKDGFYILFVEEIKKARVLPLDEVRQQIERILEQEERARIQRQHVEKLRRKAFVRIYLPLNEPS